MAAKQSGLGRGLGALLMDNAIEEQGQTISLRITDIYPNRSQPRKQFDEAALTDLADSIAKHGVLQPLLVRPMTSGEYQLVAGERRWRAARQAGLTEVPVVVREMSDREAAELAMIENLQREDLNPLEEAMGYRALMEDYALTQEETALAVNKSRPAVANALRLLQLPETVTQMVADGSLSAGHARALLGLETPEKQEKLAQLAVAQGWSVREVERRVKAERKTKTTAAKPPVARPAFFEEVELALTDRLGRRVIVVNANKGGQLQIEFYSPDDLQGLIHELLPETE